jgi:hypothetical protein
VNRESEGSFRRGSHLEEALEEGALVLLYICRLGSGSGRTANDAQERGHETFFGVDAFIATEAAGEHRGKDGQVAQLGGGQVLLALLIEPFELWERVLGYLR